MAELVQDEGMESTQVQAATQRTALRVLPRVRDNNTSQHM